LFNNLVMRDVTGPISIGLDSTRRRPTSTGTSTRVALTRSHEPGVVRNIRFNAIRATVVATGGQYDDMGFAQSYRPGETRTGVALTGNSQRPIAARQRPCASLTRIGKSKTRRTLPCG
jgi:hypothetical protein